MRLVAVWLALALWGDRPAGAAENVRLVYAREAGAESCPDEAAVRRAVTARLGYDPFVQTGERTVRATLGEKGRRLRATIELTDENGELLGQNQLTPRAGDCDTLASAVELAIALAIDPLYDSRPPSPSPQPVPTAPPVPEMEPPPPAPLLVRRRPAPAPDEDDDKPGARLVGRLAVLGSVASGPNATWGVAVGLGAQWHRFSVGAELRGDVPASRVTPAGIVSTSVVTLHFLPCVRAYGFSFCGLLTTGFTVAWGSEFAVDKQVLLPFAAGGARAAWELRLSHRLAIGIAADLLAPFTRTVLKIDDQEVYRAEPVSGAFSAMVSGVLR